MVLTKSDIGVRIAELHRDMVRIAHKSRDSQTNVELLTLSEKMVTLKSDIDVEVHGHKEKTV